MAGKEAGAGFGLERQTNEQDRRNYPFHPILIDAAEAHQTGTIKYNNDGSVTFRHEGLRPYSRSRARRIPPHFKSYIPETFQDLAGALSSVANSTIFEEDKPLIELFGEERRKYKEAKKTARNTVTREPDYGTYAYFPLDNRLYLLAPKKWHRLALVASPITLIREAEGKKSLREIREILDRSVVGFAGASVGGGIIEGWMRDGRPSQIKVADPDFVSVPNLSRHERGSLRLIADSFPRHRESLDDSGNRINKAIAVAVEQQHVDPYAEFFVYPEGLDRTNIRQFILGNGKNEPRIKVFTEEVDDLTFKVESREDCRELRTPELMLSDFGDLMQMQFQDFDHNPTLPLGWRVSDKEFYNAYQAYKGGDRDARINLIKALCGPEFDRDDFGNWLHGRGEQPVASLPQRGAIAMMSGGYGAIILTRYFLGRPIPARAIFDFRNDRVYYDAA